MKNVKFAIISIIMFMLINSNIVAQWTVTEPILEAQGIKGALDRWNMITTEVDQLYQAYDDAQQFIQMVKNQKEQLQKAMERARGIDWNGMATGLTSFDGDLRNNIKSINGCINDIGQTIAGVQDALESPNIQIGSQRFSIADMVGVGGKMQSDGKWVNNEKNIFTITTKAVSEYGHKFSTQALKEMTPAQRNAMNRKYGLNPRSVTAIASGTNYLKQKVASVLGAASAATKSLTEGDNPTAKRLADLAVKTYSTQTSDGEPSPTAITESIFHTSQEIAKQLLKLETVFDDGFGLLAADMMAKEKEKQTLKDSKDDAEKQMAGMQTEVDYDFILSPDATHSVNAEGMTITYKNIR